MKLSNILRYGIGAEGQARKRVAKLAVRKERQGAKKQSKVARFADPERWERDAGLAHRRYADYQEYLEHQASKLELALDQLHGSWERDFAEFKERFQSCGPLREARSVLCLGARLGTEVQALHSLGYFAVGIDLNPGSNNPYVLPGDFHRVVFPDECLDAIYSNAFDHVFDLDNVMSEIRRMLRAGGLFILDLVHGYEEGMAPGDFEAMHWRKSGDIIEKVRELSRFDFVEVRDFEHTQRLNPWRQAIFRKP